MDQSLVGGQNGYGIRDQLIKADANKSDNKMDWQVRVLQEDCVTLQQTQEKRPENAGSVCGGTTKGG